MLKCVQPLTLDTLCTGQYVRCGNSPGYIEEPTVVDKQSRTETFAAAVLHVHNPRWEGVPFVLKVPLCPPSLDAHPRSILDASTFRPQLSAAQSIGACAPCPPPKAGKALTDRKAEVRIQFHNVPGVISDLAKSCPGGRAPRGEEGASAEWRGRLSGFRDLALRLPANELVVRLQPEETIYWKVQNKVPGLGFETNQIRMDLLYATKFQQRKLPEARAAVVALFCVQQ